MLNTLISQWVQQVYNDVVDLGSSSQRIGESYQESHTDLRMVLRFLDLPPEIKLAIAEYLDYRDHYHLAQACRDNWKLFREAVAANKLRKKYGHLDIKPQMWWYGGQVIQTLDRILKEPTFKMHTKSLNILDAQAWFGTHDPSDDKCQSWSKHRIIKDDKRDVRLRRYYQQSPLQAVRALDDKPCDWITFESLMIMPLMKSLTNLEELAFGYNEPENMLDTLVRQYWQTPDLFPGLFQHLTHVQLASNYKESRIHHRLVHHMALIPSMKRIETIAVDTIAFKVDHYLQGKSNVEELTFQQARLRAEWLEYCLPMYAGLRRFSCYETIPGRNVYNTRALIKALLRHANHSLLSLHLGSRRLAPGIVRDQIPRYHRYISLKRFQKLQILRCEWYDIVPDQCWTSEHWYDSEFPPESERLVGILPESLYVLQIEPPRDKISAEEQVIEYLASKPPKLRRVDWDNPSEPLREAAKIAGVKLHPVVGFKGWSCVIGCDCDWHLKQSYGIIMPPELER